jgi:acyl transferase domain-containing protein/acyl-CoA synthetase (AMP-forming)/AMP-acid ligase II/acyl carrier protein
MPEQAAGSFHPDFRTLVDAVRWWSEQDPERVAVTFLVDGERETGRLTYAGLDLAARRVAARLQVSMESGSRVLLCFPSGLNFVVAYLGCLYARVLPVPVHVPRSSRHLGRLAAIVADAGAATALSEEKVVRGFQERGFRNPAVGDTATSPMPGASMLGLSWQTVEALGSGPPDGWEPPDIAPSDTAFLQYTSGSTATPRGVMVAHGNMAANIAMMSLAFGNHPGTRCVTWLPVHHDMGLIGCVIMPLWQGLSTVMMPPASFVARPARWLRAISDNAGTFVTAPNFGYELCCTQVGEEDIATLDLSSIELACNGAEPIRHATLENFARRFAPAGLRRSSLYPCYGLAEATLYVSGHHLGADSGLLADKASFERGTIVSAGDQVPSGDQAGAGPVHRLVSSGIPAAGTQVAVVDPQTGRECPPDQVGEIWLAGPQVAAGYWRNAEATAADFGATLATQPGRKFLRTGDLGFVREGQLFVTGRLKDVIIVFGRNHYPQDIEATVEANPAIRPGASAAFVLEQAADDGTNSGGTEADGIGIVAEVKINYLHADLAPVAEEIAAAVADAHDVNVIRLALVKPTALPKTTSGKLRRRHTRDLLLAGELAEVFRWPQPLDESVRPPVPVAGRHSEQAMLDLVRREASIALGRSLPPGTERPLRELGLDSVKATEMQARLAAATGLSLPSTLLFDYPTPGTLARHLADLLGGDGAGESAAASPATGPVIEPDSDEPIAIVSMSCRFPGGVDTPEALWELLAAGRDAISEYPRDRGWDAAGPPPAGGFVTGADRFDPGFFEISAREAVAIDPQQRLLLELAWEALERAGIVPASLHGSPGGVFVGISPNDYGLRLRDGGPVPAALKGYLGTGSQPSIASGRIAYTLGLEGPAISVDTSCSSSLVAIHLACQALRSGDCSLALAGGVTIIATPAVFSEMSPESAGSPDGRCKSFSAEADGAGWSEGAGLVLLERLSQAQRNAHPVLAVIRGSAVNQDGRSQGLTAPNGASQERVIRRALASARVSAADVDAVEAHGTGTSLGDPIEAGALLATYGAAHTGDRPAWLGSLKSNLGHTQAAAGVAGIMKMVLALQHGVLPRTLHARNPSPRIDWSAGGLRLLQDEVPWSGIGRRAAVSSFGISGTNAHLIVEEAPPPEPAPVPLAVPAGIPLPVPLSGRTEDALRAQAAAMRAHLDDHPGSGLGDIAAALATTRSHFEHRAVLIASDLAGLGEQLDAVSAGRPTPGVVLGQRNVSGSVAFVFPGHGPQWAGMALPMLDSSPAFRAAIEACERAFAPHLDWSLMGVLRGLDGTPALDDIDVVQPALFAMAVALAAVWRSMGVTPDAVTGHSLGEVAAAYVAGALSLEDAARVVALRGRVLRPLAGQGGVASVELPAAELGARLARFGGWLSVAAANSPVTSLVSGTVADLEELIDELTQEKVFARRVRIDYASHSEQMDTVEDELRRGLAGLAPRPSAVPFYSSVTGERLDTRRLDADYWFRNLRQQVRFAAATQSMLADGCRFFVEPSPHPALVLPLTQTLEDAGAPTVVTGSLRRDAGGLTSLLQALGTLHSRGFALDWDGFFRPLRPRRVSLPTYAFQRERFWLADDGPQRADVASAGLLAGDHPLLGAALPLADDGRLVLTGRLSPSRHPWLAGHRVAGRIVVPGPVFVELAMAAAHRTGLDEVTELELGPPLALPDDGSVTVQVTVAAADENGRRAITVHARADDAAPGVPLTRHARGLLGPVPSGPVPFGPAPFGQAQKGQAQDGQGPTEIRLPAALLREAGQFILHPELLSAALRAAGLGEPAGLPGRWAGVSVHAVGAASARLRIRPAADARPLALELTDADGELIATLAGLTPRHVTPAQLADELAASDRHLLLRTAWSEAPGVLATPDRGRVAVLGADELTRVLGNGAAPPAAVVVPLLAADGGNLPGSAVAMTGRALGLLQGWLADDRLSGRRLVLLTRGAVAAAPGEGVADLAGAALWGLVRTAQAEHPDQPIGLIDTDESPASRQALDAAVLSGQSQLALRDGRALIPRLTPVIATSPRSRPLDPDGTVLITGGTGVLGGLVARHLAGRHGVRHLLLASRRGSAADLGALRDELAVAGARLTVAACDVADRDAVRALLAGLPAEHPLTGVIHAAGVLDDAVLTALTQEQLATVMRAKADGAWHLHELTETLDLSAFVLFSSAAGVLGSAGQAGYAAANAFLDGLAQHRAARGQAAVAIGWGPWAERSSFTARLTAADHKRLARSGIRVLATGRGLALLDAALAGPEATVTAAHFDPAALAANAGTLPAILRGLAPVMARRRAASTPSPTAFRRRLLAGTAADAVPLMLDLVRAEAAVVLGIAPANAIEAERSLESMGLDSLRALELRTRLATVLELALPVYLIRERGSVANLAQAVLERLLLHMTSDMPPDALPGAPDEADGAREPVAYQQETV